MTWQEWVQQNLPPGTRETSGYRSPQAEAALGGPASSYHTRGTPTAPGAIDVGGPAAQLKALFDQIKQAFAGRINELYLNLPGGTSEDIKNNQALGRNPEAGRPQHLHIALGGVSAAVEGPPLAPWEQRMNNFLHGLPAPAGGVPGIGSQPAGNTCVDCGRSFTIPFGGCHCWSDVWVYGAGLFLVVVGGLLLFRGKG